MGGLTKFAVRGISRFALRETASSSEVIANNTSRFSFSRLLPHSIRNSRVFRILSSQEGFIESPRGLSWVRSTFSHPLTKLSYL